MEKFKEQDDTIFTLMRRVHILSTIIEKNGTNVNELEHQLGVALGIDNEEGTIFDVQDIEDIYLSEIIEPSETLRIEIFDKDINKNNWVMEWGEMKQYSDILSLLKDISKKYEISYKCHFNAEKNIIDLGMCEIIKRVENDNGIFHEAVTNNELDSPITSCPYMYVTCTKTKVAKFTKTNGNLTLKDLLEILNRVYKMYFNEDVPQLKHYQILKRLEKMRHSRFRGTCNVIPAQNEVRAYPIDLKWISLYDDD